MNRGSIAILICLSFAACGDAPAADAPAANAEREGAQKAEADAEPPKAAEPAPKGEVKADAHGAKEVPGDEVLCQHIVDISHEELKHLDELDAELEAQALQECRERVKKDREFYGIAFAPLAECVFLATSLSEIGLCEDSFAHALAGEDLDQLIEKIALEEPIVDAELCMHRRKIDPESKLADCKAELVGLRKQVGNMDFDEYAWCMMEATDEAHFLECEEEAKKAHAAHEATGRVSVAIKTDATAADAIAALTKLADLACACKDEPCATEVAHALDDWTHRFRQVGGSREDEMQAESIAARLVACEQKVAGANWASKVHDLAAPSKKKAG